MPGTKSRRYYSTACCVLFQVYDGLVVVRGREVSEQGHAGSGNGADAEPGVQRGIVFALVFRVEEDGGDRVQRMAGLALRRLTCMGLGPAPLCTPPPARGLDLLPLPGQPRCPWLSWIQVFLACLCSVGQGGTAGSLAALLSLKKDRLPGQGSGWPCVSWAVSPREG